VWLRGLRENYFTSCCESTIGAPEVEWQYLLGIAAAFVSGNVPFDPVPDRVLFVQYVLFPGHDYWQLSSVAMGRVAV
jgi:hypothetical protein